MANKSSWPGRRDGLRAMMPGSKASRALPHRYTKQVFVCLGISDIRAEEDCVTGRIAGIDPPEVRLIT